MTIRNLPVTTTATNGDLLPLWDVEAGSGEEPTKRITAENMAKSINAMYSPYVATITAGQWSGSGSDYYITVTASNVTADSILIPNYDQASLAYLNGPVWCVPAAGSFTIHTSALPSGTVTVMVQFVGVMGTAQYQVLADVYSTSQIDAMFPLSLVKGGLGVDFSSADNAGFHNSIKRGKYLGNSFTTAQSTAITSGLFTDMFVGDYWTINGVDWVIVDFDPYYQCGDTIILGHHIAVVPRASLYNAQWNTSNDTSGGYIGSAIRAGIKASGGAEEKVIAAFGSSHVLSYRALYPSAYSSGKATSWAWTDARVELLNETEVYGHQVWTGGGNCNGYEDGINKRQLALFALDPTFTNIRAGWWLRSVRSATDACSVDHAGNATYYGASNSLGVRPLSLIA